MSDDLVAYKQLRGNKELIKEAQSMYYSNISPVEICSHLNIDINELGTYVFGEDGTGVKSNCWYVIRRDRQSRGDLSTVADYTVVKSFVIKRTEQKMLNKIEKAVDLVDEEDMGISGIRDLVSSLEKIDRIGRLEDGKATEHVHQTRQTFSLRDIVAQVNKPEQIEDAEIVETKGDNNEDICEDSSTSQ
jgi:hypothetical protein